MNEFVSIIINNELPCFCYKYHKPDLFELTKQLEKYNNEIIDFRKAEFQALFYFLIVLNTYIRDNKPFLLDKKIIMYFDRNVYGKEELEAFSFENDNFVLEHMTFVEKSNVSLLSLPDFFGYIFRKSKKSSNKVQFGDNSIEKSPLTINSYKCLLQLVDAKLFYFLDADYRVLEKALGMFL